jgi:hypothetical protein
MGTRWHAWLAILCRSHRLYYLSLGRSWKYIISTPRCVGISGMGGHIVDDSAGRGSASLWRILGFPFVCIVLQPVFPQFPRKESRGNQGVICAADDGGDIWQLFGLLGWASPHQHQLWGRKCLSVVWEFHWWGSADSDMSFQTLLHLGWS